LCAGLSFMKTLEAIGRYQKSSMIYKRGGKPKMKEGIVPMGGTLKRSKKIEKLTRRDLNTGDS